MSSYLKRFEDFLQKKEIDVKRPKSISTDVDEEISGNEEPSASESTTPKAKMEHSYTRDNVRIPGNDFATSGLAPARTVLVRRRPQTSSSHAVYLSDEYDRDDGNQASIPTFNEISAKESMNECGRIAKYVKNTNPVDDNWESRVNQIGWTNMQKSLFEKVVHILDSDQLGRLANEGRSNEVMQRRVVVDKSAARMRKVLATVEWDPRLTQWLHCMLMDCLPSTYMASYLDILQTLRNKVPSLMEKMLFGRPMNFSQDLLAPVMKKTWEPAINAKVRQLPQSITFITLPSMPLSGQVPNRLQKWYQHLANIGPIIQITLPNANGAPSRQPLEQVAEQIVSLTRVKIQELRTETPNRNIVLMGFNAGAAMALQVAMSENISCVICMGLAYNTLTGVRGAPDDRILDIKIPILFVIGQNSARTSTEEIEGLREKMQSESSLVIVGSADDMLRVPKSKRKVENVTQTMIDTMVVDEVFEFIKKILIHPPGPRVPTSLLNYLYPKPNRNILATEGSAVKTTPPQRKRKGDNTLDGEQSKPKSVPHIGRPRTRPFTDSSTIQSTALVNSQSLGSNVQAANQSVSNEDLSMAISSILNDSTEESSGNSKTESPQKLMTSFELVSTNSSPIKSSISQLPKPIIVGTDSAAGTKIKMIPANQFVQLKPPIQSQSKIYTIKPPVTMLSQQQISTTTPNTGANVQQQIFTLKSPNGQTTQFVTAAPASAQQKFTVVKNATGGSTVQLANPTGGGTVQLTNSPGGTMKNLSNSTSLSLSIMDMPIVFTDKDGNYTETVSSVGDNAKTPAAKSGTASSGVGQLIISQKIIKEASPIAVTSPNLTSPPSTGIYMINKTSSMTPQISPTHSTTQPLSKPNKVVLVNRHNVKPLTGVVRPSLPQSMSTFAKVLVTNPKTATSNQFVTRPSAQIMNASGAEALGTPAKQFNLRAIPTSSPSGILNVSTKSMPAIKIIKATGMPVSSTGEKPQIRNIVLTPNTIPLPGNMGTQFMNRGLTVRKLVNILPASKTGVTIAATGAPSTATTLTPPATLEAAGGTVVGSSSVMQTLPKIFTLNPINPSTGTLGSTQPKSD